MPKQVIADTFETLGGITKQTVKQVAQIPFKIAETVPSQLTGVGVNQETGIEKPQGGQTQSPAQQALNKKATERKLVYLRDELNQLRQKRAQELPKQVTGQPGFSQEKAIKQLETTKGKKEKEKEPWAISQAKLKGGTGERKRMGSSG